MPHQAGPMPGRRHAILGASALAAGLAAPRVLRAQAPVEMVMTDELATSHWSTKILDSYAERIRERSGGRITPKVFHAGTLHRDKEAVAALGSGSVHMVWPIAVQLEGIAPQAGVVTLPFALTDEVMLREGAPEAVGRVLNRYTEPRGIRTFGLMRAADLIFLQRDRDVTAPDSLRGRKVRVTGGRVLQVLMREFGATPVSMPAPEMAPALMQGAIDAILTSAGGWEIVGISAAHNASYVPGLNLLSYAVLADDAWLKRLPPDLRDVVETTTAELVRTNWQTAMQADKTTLDRLVAQGGTMHQVNGEPREAFRRLASRANDDFIRRYPKPWQELQEALAPFQAPA